ncbi:MAG: hypothetical protein WA970_22380 [Gammaproteobacteria bacterium]
MELLHKLSCQWMHHALAPGIVAVGYYLSSKLASLARGTMLLGFCRVTLIAVLASVAPSAAGGPISPDARGQVGALGFRWGASAQDLKGVGARPIPNSPYAGSDLGAYLGVFDERDEAFRATANLPGKKELLHGHLGFFVDRKHGLHTVIFVVNKDFQSAADLSLYYQEIKNFITQIRGAPVLIAEQNRSGNWTDRRFFDCLGENPFASWIVASDCRMEAMWITNTARLDLVAWGVNGSGAIALIESLWPAREELPLDVGQ